MGKLPSTVRIREVGPRDGLQHEAVIPTEAKVRLINALSQTGVRRIETVSFPHPKAVPQLADAEQVWAAVDRVGGVRYSALAPNARGAHRALRAGFAEIELVVAASETYHRKHTGRSPAETLDEIAALIHELHDRDVTVEVIVAASFGCPYEGDIDPARVTRIVDRVVTDGADRVSLADNTGMATPRWVREVVGAVRQRQPGLSVLLHFHDTRGTALANILTALELGVIDFDASVGGLGGCRDIPGANGNIATEEVVHMLDDLGIRTGIDLEALLAAASLAEELVGRRLPSGVLRAGPRSRVNALGRGKRRSLSDRS